MLSIAPQAARQTEPQSFDGFQLNDFTAKATIAPRSARYEKPSAAPSNPDGPAGSPLPVLTFV